MVRATHGMRWRRKHDNPDAPAVDHALTIAYPTTLETLIQIFEQVVADCLSDGFKKLQTTDNWYWRRHGLIGLPALAAIPDHLGLDH